eukprot:15442018-Alexandrium_andersonii.AAC.1
MRPPGSCLRALAGSRGKPRARRGLLRPGLPSQREALLNRRTRSAGITSARTCPSGRGALAACAGAWLAAPAIPPPKLTALCRRSPWITASWRRAGRRPQ